MIVTILMRVRARSAETRARELKRGVPSKAAAAPPASAFLSRLLLMVIELLLALSPPLSLASHSLCRLTAWVAAGSPLPQV